MNGEYQSSVKGEVWSFIKCNFTFHYTNGVYSLTNSEFRVYNDRIYPIESEINDTTGTVRPASYLDIHLHLTVRAG